MTIGQLGMKHPSLGGMVTAIKTRISRVALHYRFSAAASAFLLKCLQFVLHQKFSCLGQINTKLLRPFRRVLIVDSSSWDISENLRSVLPGSGGAASTANCKLQAVYDYKHSVLSFLDVTAGTVPDNRYTNHLPGMLQKGDLLLIDQGYFKLSTFTDIIAKKAFFLTRFLVRTVLQDAITHAPIHTRCQSSDLSVDIEVCRVYAYRMPRKPRIEYEGALYHVMSRGDRQEAIYLTT